jgi:hypothetical protein
MRLPDPFNRWGLCGAVDESGGSNESTALWLRKSPDRVTGRLWKGIMLRTSSE